jgi:hypothetical protein
MAIRAPRFLRRRSTHRALALLFILYSIFEVLQILRCLTRPLTNPGSGQAERVYIASLHWNNERILRSHWNDALVALSVALGRENVFISVYESGSWDNSKGALQELDTMLERQGIRRNITLSDVTHLDEMSSANKGAGWVDTPRGRKELRRIPYLSRLRNLTLQPLQDLYTQGERFDKILFLNDVIFTVCYLDCARDEFMVA